MKRILVDMDEVIADTTGGMVQWYKETYGGDIDYHKMLEGGSLVKGFAPENQAAVRQKLFEPGFFRYLPVMDDSIEILKQMNNKYEIYIVSAATEFPNSLTDKFYWLADNYPFFTWQQLVLCGDKKMIQADFMIDDHTRHLQYFKGKAYMFSAPHNLNENNYERINNWKHAGEIFL